MKTVIDITKPVQTVYGPVGLSKLCLKLDASQIYPDDPGMGTPMLFEYKDASNYRKYWHETMTWTCGYEGGNLGEIFPEEKAFKIDAALAWAESISEQVSAWEDYHWQKATGK